MGKFEECFSEVNYFSDSCYVISGYLTLSDAAKAFSEYTGEDVNEVEIKSDLVRYGFSPENVVDGAGLGACWYTGARKGKGSKPVWVLG